MRASCGWRAWFDSHHPTVAELDKGDDLMHTYVGLKATTLCTDMLETCRHTCFIHGCMVQTQLRLWHKLIDTKRPATDVARKHNNARVRERTDTQASQHARTHRHTCRYARCTHAICRRQTFFDDSRSRNSLNAFFPCTCVCSASSCVACVAWHGAACIRAVHPCCASVLCSLSREWAWVRVALEAHRHTDMQAGRHTGHAPELAVHGCQCTAQV